MIRALFAASAATQNSPTGMKTAMRSITVRSGSARGASTFRPATKKNTVTPASQSTVRTSAIVSDVDSPEDETRRL